MDELKKIAPELSKLKKENPYRTPEYYFDDFSARLQMQIEAEKRASKPNKVNFIQILKPALGLAASFALIFMLVYVPLKTFVPHKMNTVAESSNELDNGILNYIEDIDESAFVTLLNESESNETEFSEDELALYVSANFSDYEIYENLENK